MVARCDVSTSSSKPSFFRKCAGNFCRISTLAMTDSRVAGPPALTLVPRASPTLSSDAIGASMSLSISDIRSASLSLDNSRLPVLSPVGVMGFLDRGSGGDLCANGFATSGMKCSLAAASPGKALLKDPSTSLPVCGRGVLPFSAGTSSASESVVSRRDRHGSGGPPLSPLLSRFSVDGDLPPFSSGFGCTKPPPSSIIEMRSLRRRFTLPRDGSPCGSSSPSCSRSSAIIALFESPAVACFAEGTPTYDAIHASSLTLSDSSPPDEDPNNSRRVFLAAMVVSCPIPRRLRCVRGGPRGYCPLQIGAVAWHTVLLIQHSSRPRAGMKSVTAFLVSLCKPSPAHIPCPFVQA
mmetsp:Transcript_21234/g.55408  ORF Transcript_21234/g.55408 Transcript_21234/m.55408 type:complete len:351 (-) Transcript_21234:12-1064(-)